MSLDHPTGDTAGASLRPPETAPAVELRAVIDAKYRLEEKLGDGGMGSVYRARHEGLNRSFALKLIRPAQLPEAEMVERFRVEAKALGRLRHASIVGVTDFGVDERLGGVPYLVMEYVEGKTVRDRLDETDGRLDSIEALAILDSIAAGIDHAHGRGVLHRDLKPDNILIEQGHPAAAKITDFGLAALLQPDLEEGGDSGMSIGSTPRFTTPVETHAALGTLPYVAPEILRGEPAAVASDIYALGATAYEMLVGRRPFVGTPTEVASKHLHESPRAPSRVCASLPHELDGALMWALQKDPALRPLTASEYVAAVRAALARGALREWRRSQASRRIGLAAFLTVAGACLLYLASSLTYVGTAEHRLEDLLFSAVAPRAPDPRVVLITMDEQAVQSLTAGFDTEVGRMCALLQKLLDSGARSLVLDLLFSERYASHQEFSRLILSNRDRLVLSVFVRPDGGLVGTECLGPLTTAAIGSPEEARALFGVVNLEPDDDGRIRRFRTFYQTAEGVRVPSLAEKAALCLSPSALSRTSGEVRRLDFTTAWTEFRRVPWVALESALRQDPGSFRDKLVLVGAETSAQEDAHSVPMIRGRPGVAPGLTLQALAINTLLAPTRIRQAESGATYSLFVALAFPALALLLMLAGPRILSLTVAAVFVVTALLAPALFIGWRLIVPWLPLLLAWLLVLAIAALVRRHLAPPPLIPSS